MTATATPPTPAEVLAKLRDLERALDSSRDAGARLNRALEAATQSAARFKAALEVANDRLRAHGEKPVRVAVIEVRGELAHETTP